MKPSYMDQYFHVLYRKSINNVLLTCAVIIFIYFLGRKILCHDPQQRLETEGMPVPVSSPSQICASRRGFIFSERIEPTLEIVFSVFAYWLCRENFNHYQQLKLILVSFQ